MRTNAPDPALVKAVAHSYQVFDQPYNNNDPEALANLFTDGAVLVTDKGIFHGRAEILEYEISIFKDCHFSDHKSEADLASTHTVFGSDGKQFWPAGSWSQKLAYKGDPAFPMSGCWSAIVLTDGAAKTRCRLGTSPHHRRRHHLPRPALATSSIADPRDSRLAKAYCNKPGEDKESASQFPGWVPPIRKSGRLPDTHL